MAFPVDLLADVSQTELEQAAHSYMNQLLYSDPDAPEHLVLSDSTQVTIDISTVGFIPLYGSSDKQKILAFFTPKDPLTAVALYLLDRWWTVDTILKTADSARDGPVEVETLGERIVLYILNRVIYRAKEMSTEELPFLCHGENDHAKILWNNGEAVGFYSVKPTGSFYNAVSTRRYQLPVMDSIFVRKCQRGKGFGLQMLEDFVLSFKEDCLGLRYPLTKSMYKVCEKYLCQYPGDTGLLWEVESIGSPNQRTSIASKIHTLDASASKRLSFTRESLVITEMTGKDVVMEAISTQVKEAGSMECTVEIVEEVTVLNATRVPEAEVPLTARARSSGEKKRKMGEKTAEEKVIRIEDIEAETPREEQQKTELHVSELHIKSVFSLAPEEQGQDVVEASHEEAATVLRPQHVPAAPQAEDDEAQDLNEASFDSQIAVENVVSEVGEESQQEDAAEPEVHKEAETEGTEIKVTEERVTQHETNLPTRETSEDKEAGKTTTVQSKTPRRKSRRLRKLEDGAKEKVCEEVEQEVDEVAEKKDVSTAELVEEMAPIKEDAVVVEESTEERLEDEDTDESKTQKQQEAGEEGAAAKEQTDEVETPVIQNEQDVTDDETDKPPAEDARSEETAEEQVEEHHQVKQETSTEEAIVVEEGTVPEAKEAAEDGLPSTELNVKESNKMPEEQETGAEREEEAADDVMLEPDTGEPQDKDSSASEIPKLQKATVILVDIKTTCHHLSVEEAEETRADAERAHPEQQGDRREG